MGLKIKKGFAIVGVLVILCVGSIFVMGEIVSGFSNALTDEGNIVQKNIDVPSSNILINSSLPLPSCPIGLIYRNGLCVNPFFIFIESGNY
jgi:hypothetical protein